MCGLTRPMKLPTPSFPEYSRDQVIVENQTLVEKASGEILPKKGKNSVLATRTAD